MITEFHLNNWKSYTDSSLYIDPLTMIIGNNASGKSNILDAFYFLSRIAQGHRIETVVNETRGGREWLIQKGKKSATLTVVVAEDKADVEYRYSITLVMEKDVILVEKEQLTRIDKTLTFTVNSIDGGLIKQGPVETKLFSAYGDRDMSNPVMSVFSRRSTQGPDRKYPLNRICSVLSQMPTIDVLKKVKDGVACVISNLSNIFILDPIPNNMRGYKQLATSLATDASNLAGVLSGMDDERKAEVERVLTHYICSLPERDIKRVWTERVGMGYDAMLYCEEQWTKDKTSIIDSRSMSDGTLRFLAIMTAILTMQKGSLLVVEEVDNGLHPSRAKELIDMLRSLGKDNEVDVLCTTHNPVLLDEMGLEMIPFVFYIKRDPQTGGSVIKSLDDRENLTNLLAQNSMGELMTEDKL
jgi:predicted ATPase